jgi:hypothetical protein
VHVFYLILLISLLAFWVAGKKLYFIYENVDYEKITLVANGFYQSGRRRETSVIFKSENTNRSMLLRKILLTEVESKRLQSLAGDCVITEGFDTSTYGYIPLAIKGCRGDIIFKRDYEWYENNYKKFTPLDTAILILSIFGILIGLIYSGKESFSGSV